jgi:hypothetical protein
MTSEDNENTPLLNGNRDGVNGTASGKDRPTRKQKLASTLRRLFALHVEKRILFAGFFITLSFSFTQVP